MRRRVALLGSWLILISTIPLGQANSPSTDNLDIGKRIYEQRCLDCHGPEGRGDGIKAPYLSPRPGNLVSAATSAKSDKDLLKIIANGRPRTAMPAWKDELTEEEQREVLRYIRSLVRFHRPLTPSPPTP